MASRLLRISGRLRPVVGVAVALVAIGTLAAACGGGNGSALPGVATLTPKTGVQAGSKAGATTTTAINATASGASGEVESALLRYARCMQTHGEPNYPSVPYDDPGGMDKIDQSSPLYIHANEVCRKDLPHVTPPPPAEIAAVQAKALKFAHCMQSHGMPSWPDPSPNGGYMVGLAGPAANSPVYKGALKTCRHLLP